MKITNVTARVIGVLGTDLMPDQSMEITAKQAAAPNIAAIINMGFLSVDNKAELEKAQMSKAMEAARRQVMAELRAAGKLKDDDEPAAHGTDASGTAADEEQSPKRSRRPKAPEAAAQ